METTAILFLGKTRKEAWTKLAMLDLGKALKNQKNSASVLMDWNFSCKNNWPKVTPDDTFLHGNDLPTANTTSVTKYK